MLIDPKSVFWDDWLLLFVQIAGLVALIVYVIKTWQMASATRLAAEANRDMAKEALDARLESLAPRVVVYFDASRHLEAQVVIQNAGAGTAANVQHMFQPPLESTVGDDPFRAFFDLPQSVMPPGYTIAHPFDTWPQYLSSGLPRKYRVTVEYAGLENGRSYKTDHEINVESLRWRVVHGDPLHIEEFFRLAKDTSRHIETVARTVAEHFAAELYFQGLSLDRGEAANVLTSLWTSAEAAQSSQAPQSFVRQWTAMLQVFRVLAIAAFAHETRFPHSASEKEALHDVLRTLHRIDADVFGNDDWQKDAKAAFSKLAVELATHTNDGMRSETG